ncbi:MAG TPA: tRNA preQ1(34) S-adenosylmethionine ribosyltransferase-isomerase QueA [Alphaproteobacteria bacterium]|nr:tRNA preQ1(34) S-adenosylmethionine ribosyltransferase-isomerase QueA [Alphaproteobacteria bacterium]
MTGSTTTTDRPLPLEAFDFDLPRERIASRPARPRDAARLLHVSAAGLRDHIVRDLPQLLRPGDLLVLNDTKVIPARLLGHRRGAKVELTLHQRVAGNRWRAFAKPARKLVAGDVITFAAEFSAEVTEKGDAGEVELRFELSDEALFAALDRHGAPPLPPYIKRAHGPDAEDRTDYQTIYAREAGAVAAPTAGLHFTEALIQALDARGVRRAALTLHVGAGTFLPVKTNDLRHHRMHGEFGSISEESAARVNETRREGGRIIAVGSTSLRLLETAADERGKLRPFVGETRLFILPGYRFKLADLMLTNFHLPRSTLFALVCAFAGCERMRAAYAHAIERHYRFYSYGDCCLLERSEAP